MNIESGKRATLLQEFLYHYDSGHSLSFNDVKFRPGAKRTTGFGIDTTTTQYTKLRIHLAIDSARSNSTGYKIFAPFEIVKTEYLEDYLNFGTLLLLYTRYGFHIRIAHIAPEDFSSPENLEKARAGEGFKASEYIADCGEAGLSFGKHAHVEVVSNENDFTILDDILKEKYGESESLYKNYSDEEIQGYLDSASLDSKEGWDLYEKEYSKRRMKILNDYIGYRRDYYTGEDRMFYNSMAIFGM